MDLAKQFVLFFWSRQGSEAKKEGIWQALSDHLGLCIYYVILLMGGCQDFEYLDHKSCWRWDWWLNVLKIFLQLKKKFRRWYFCFFSTEILLYLGVTDNQILLHFAVPDNQILLRLSVPDKPILLHLGVPNNCSSGPGMSGRIYSLNRCWGHQNRVKFGCREHQNRV